MKRLLILGVIVAILGWQTTPAESADASGVWNQFAASYNFNTTYGGPLNGTFVQNYHGSNFSADFAGILDAVAQVMGTARPPYGGGDVMNTSLQNWPNP